MTFVFSRMTHGDKNTFISGHPMKYSNVSAFFRVYLTLRKAVLGDQNKEYIVSSRSYSKIVKSLLLCACCRFILFPSHSFVSLLQDFCKIVKNCVCVLQIYCFQTTANHPVS
jgi:hypothetical protein